MTHEINTSEDLATYKPGDVLAAVGTNALALVGPEHIWIYDKCGALTDYSREISAEVILAHLAESAEKLIYAGNTREPVRLMVELNNAGIDWPGWLSILLDDVNHWRNKHNQLAEQGRKQLNDLQNLYNTKREAGNKLAAKVSELQAEVKRLQRLAGKKGAANV